MSSPSSELSHQINQLSNSEKIKFMKLLQTFKGGSLEKGLILAKTKENTEEKESSKPGVINLLGGFIKNRLKGVISFMKPNFTKKNIE